MKNSRKKIINTAINLFKENGYENTSIVDICKACNITKGTFYYHFNNKDEITIEFYESMYEDFTETFSELIMIDDAKEQLWRVYEYSIDRTIALTPKVLYGLLLSDIQKGLTYFSPYQNPNLSNKSSQQLKLQIDLVKKGQASNTIKQGDPQMMVTTFIAALVGIAITWASNDGPFDEKNELRKAFDIIF